MRIRYEDELDLRFEDPDDVNDTNEEFDEDEKVWR